MAILFYYSRLSSAQLDRWQAPMQRPIIDKCPVEQTAYRREIKDNGYKSVFTNSWLVRWIKGFGKNPQNSELVHCWQCLLSGATEPWTHTEPWTVPYMYMWHVHCTVRACAVLTGSHVDALLSYRSKPVRIGLFIVVKLTMLTYRHVKLTILPG